MRVHTKIICTIGPSVLSYEKILELMKAGMNVARINMSHGSHKQHEKTINLLKKARADTKNPLAIMLDTKGPEVRVGPINGDQILLKKGQELSIVKQCNDKTNGAITLNPAHIVDDISLKAQVLFDDGYIASRVIKKNAEGVIVKIENGGLLKSFKGVNIPHVDLTLPAVTEQDKQDIIFGCQQGIDIIAASFIRSSDHIEFIKEMLLEETAAHILVIAKIESALGVKNFDAILKVSDGIMVARGDLGVELPITKVPSLQKEMIFKCNNAFKPVVTATQMLESMIKNPRPTRAEVSDVANAIYDSTSAVMLSGETAVGAYPIETVKLMRTAALEAEKEFCYADYFHCEVLRQTYEEISYSVALAAVKTAYSSKAKALIALTSSGFTAQIMSRFRPKIPIIAITEDEKVFHQLAFYWGVIPLLCHESSMKEGLRVASAFLIKHKFAKSNDCVVMTSGVLGVSGTTNMMCVETVAASGRS